ncbi:unnamed protein product [Schistosoma rodhaini]|uniref:Microsomal glutathione S-transferase 1 n=1 Tax=Schistosoma mansoni TaxID=6183 RepID=G4VQ47_SCHMA|nr:Microsomal GST-1 [Schistosoma mansoni]CAH8676407.1 unnamed protein product [Schistosoma rodhaini]|eukprot:XP_018655067.1 Microsomal GST-1 [Schistosoma mansoni]
MKTTDMRGAFAFYGSILALKTLVLAGATIIKRLQTKSSCKDQPHPDVQSIQRCHSNDLENLVPFLFLGLLYCSTDAPATVGLWHFRIFALARILHTPAYLLTEGRFPIGLIFLVGYIVNISLALKSILYFSETW